MASSSVLQKACFHCSFLCDNLYPGWQLRNGGYALLCQRCGSAYSNGTFCDIFHSEATGWRDCASCNKPIHCGCIMASQTYAILDFGGVKCAECAINEALAPHRCLPTLWSPEAMQHAREPAQRLSMDAARMIPVQRNYDPRAPVAGVNLGVGRIPYNVQPNKIAAPITPGAVFQPEPPVAEIEEEPSVNSPAEPKKSRRRSGGKHQKNTHRQAKVQSRYLPKTSSEELNEICRMAKSSLIPLFEKALTASDVDFKNGRLVVPKRCAEAYFPKLSGQRGMFLVVQDIKGNDWELYYRYWSNNSGKMYVLEGLKEHIIMMHWQAGDKVTFYKREADGKLVMGFKKSQAANLDPKLHWHQSWFKDIQKVPLFLIRTKKDYTWRSNMQTCLCFDKLPNWLTVVRLDFKSGSMLHCIISYIA